MMRVQYIMNNLSIVMKSNCTVNIIQLFADVFRTIFQIILGVEISS